MPDISMCEGKNCLIKKACYRHTAKASNHQSFSDYFLNNKDGNTCEDFIDNKKHY